MTDKENMTCDLDYKAEYMRLRDEIEKAKCELHYMHERWKEAEAERKESEVIKRTLYVVFGRSFDND